MITIQNYFQQKEHIDWSKISEQTKKDLSDIEELIETAIEAPESLAIEEIRLTIDEFLEEINRSLKKKRSVKKASAEKSSVKTKKTNTKRRSKKISIEENEKTRLSTALQIKNTTYFKKLVPYNQQWVLTESNSEEYDDVITRVEKELASIPKEPQGESIQKSTVYAHYMHGATDWYITDMVEDRDSLFGYIILNGDLQNAEAGYFSIEELTKKRDHRFTAKYGVTELDFHFKKDRLENILHKKYPHYYPNPKQESTTKTNKPKSKKTTTKIKKTVDVKTVDHYSVEYRLIRRFYNLIRLQKAATFRKIQLLYLAFQKAALERTVRKMNANADLFTKVNEKVVALFDIVNPTKGDAEIEFTDKKLFSEIETFVKEQKVNYAITLLKSYMRMQGYAPERIKVERLLKRIQYAFEKDKVTTKNRLYKQLKAAQRSLNDYLENAEEKLAPKLIGLSLPARSLCTNRIKCVGLRKDGKLNKGYRFLEGGSVIASKKKAV